MMHRKTLEQKWIAPLSLVLMLPALVLCGSGLLYLFFGLSQANRFLETLIRNPWTGLLFSPVIVLGGACLTLVLNAYRVCQFRLGAEDDAVVVSIGIRRNIGNILLGMTAVSLVTLLLVYAFVENFQIVPRG